MLGNTFLLHLWGYSYKVNKQYLKTLFFQNGLLSAAPYFTLWILGFVFSPITDKLIANGTFSIGTSRKIMNTIGTLFFTNTHTHTQKTNSDNYKKIPGVGIPAVALIFLSLLDSGKATVISLLVIAVGFNAAIFCGFNVNHIDLSPNHSGTLMGITNGFSNIFSIVAPLLVQYIVTDEVRQQINNIFVT